MLLEVFYFNVEFFCTHCVDNQDKAIRLAISFNVLHLVVFFRIVLRPALATDKFITLALSAVVPCLSVTRLSFEFRKDVKQSRTSWNLIKAVNTRR